MIIGNQVSRLVFLLPFYCLDYCMIRRSYLTGDQQVARSTKVVGPVNLYRGFRPNDALYRQIVRRDCRSLVRKHASVGILRLHILAKTLFPFDRVL